ncbi:MAG: DUF480 domain-containing protein [Pseudomonadota bacterium]
MIQTLTNEQARVIGVLMEKEITTPDQYPLSLNGVTVGCNQKSNRDPVMQLSESQVQAVLDELNERNMLFVEQGSRVAKYKHRFCNTEFSSLKFTAQEFAIICVLLLRGPQTPGELRTRTNRLTEFNNVQEVEQALTGLSDFNGDTLVVKLERESGKRESRYAHMFCGEVEQAIQSAASHDDHQFSGDSTIHTNTNPTLADAIARIEVLEEQVASLIEQLKR